MRVRSPQRKYLYQGGFSVPYQSVIFDGGVVVSHLDGAGLRLLVAQRCLPYGEFFWACGKPTILEKYCPNANSKEAFGLRGESGLPGRRSLCSKQLLPRCAFLALARLLSLGENDVWNRGKATVKHAFFFFRFLGHCPGVEEGGNKIF